MEIINVIMGIFFILFMVFIFCGYHKNKSAAREAQFKRDEEKKSKEDETL